MAILLIGLITVVDPTFQHQIDLAYYLMLLSLIALHGPGAVSLDSLIVRTLLRRFPELEGMRTKSYESAPCVLIVGGGFGGVAAAKALRKTSCRVTLIDQPNYYLFQPLLYQVATAGLSPADIAGPIRGLFRDQPNVRVLLGGVTDVDLGTHEVIMQDARVLYDYLVIAAGARHSYFGHDEWAPFAPGLKQIEDATSIRSRLLFAFEQAENAQSPAVQHEMLTFVIVGGGPTGVELARAIAELARHGLAHEFRAIDPVSGTGDLDAGRASDSADISGELVPAGDGGPDDARRRGAHRQCRRTDRRGRRHRLRPSRCCAQCILGRGRNGLSCGKLVEGRSGLVRSGEETTCRSPV
jgi:Pyridine nucleotide-disulphide oxidoreductase